MLLSIILIFSIYLLFFYWVKVPSAIATEKLAFKFPDKYLEYTTVKCDLPDLINSEHAFVGIRPERDPGIFFFNVGIGNVFSRKIELVFTGATTVKNITFPELVAMVKEDCSQFQKGHGGYYGNELTWSYTEAEPEKTPEELGAERAAEEYSQRLHDYKLSTGQIKPEPGYKSLEEGLRASGFFNEEEIKEAVEEAGYDYVGPQ